ncbi:UDP-N-acetylenolpyruvoylglucosamine reductase [Saccharobesus litoralis]|uniref:UDP-N-acetylenolpyruvoylglucosamine reductase n=1 Tax=Saccharobesus litoralis TaxID=2172099 RepID=A0A2S0VRA3_9ALTE|nr:UDP-N-acetylmuramate dehydrogenase [Saccharobesus litoralis]AWB66712.1 UDP-N-acetylenolpyruvoylglucosamine reductase [Saccharobesus litoralis]
MHIPNTFGLDVSGPNIIYIDETTTPNDLPDNLIMVGEGSNLLFTVSQISFPIGICQHQVFDIAETEHFWLIQLGAGLNWHQTVARLLDLNVTGLENLALIPGLVGAAPVQNIGAYGLEFSQVCQSVSGIDLIDKKRKTLTAQECCFAYRDSVFKHRLKHQFIIEQVEIKLSKHTKPRVDYGPLQKLGEQATAKQVFDKVCQIRSEKLPNPNILGNAGSFFKNPIVTHQEVKRLKKKWPDMPCYAANHDQTKLAAGYLIDQAGLKGLQVGGASVHVNQALVLVNNANATGNDVVELAKRVKAKVFEIFGVNIEAEVRFFNKDGEIASELILGN